MNDQALRFRLGIFMLAALILLAVLITLFGGFPNYFRSTETYTLVFDDAQGVSAGTPVRRSGVKIGEVRDLALDDDTGQVRITIQVREGFRIRKADRPTLVQGFLTGDTAIAFLPPPDEEKAPAGKVEPGATLKGVVGAEPGALLRRTQELMPPAQEALVEIKKFFERFDKMAPKLERTLDRFDEIAKSTSEFIPELRKTNVQIQELVKGTNEFIPTLKAASKDFAELARAGKDFFPKMEAAAEDFRGLAKAGKEFFPKMEGVADELRGLAKAGKDYIPRLDQATTEFQGLVKDARLSVPDLKRTNEEVQLVARTWGKFGERLDIMLQTNEEKLTKSIDRLQEVLYRVSEVFNDENQRNLKAVLRNVKTGSDRFDSLAKESESLLKDSRITVSRLNEALLKADKVLVNIEKASKPFADRSDSILRNLDDSTANLNKTLVDLREIFQALARNDGTLQRLLSDPQLYHNINDTATAVNRLLPRVDRILRDVEVFADRIARHPEALGLGGVVRPSTGLKSSPTVFPWRPVGH